MKLVPTTLNKSFLCSVFLCLSVCISCNKDEDVFYEAIKNGDLINNVDNLKKDNDVDETEQNPEQEEDDNTEESLIPPSEDEEVIDSIVVKRTTAFAPIQDAYIENGNGKNSEIIRLQENKRTSYLLYDLSAVDSINGKIIDSYLEFTVDKDSGNGLIQVLKGSSNQWNESNLNDNIAPEPLEEIGNIKDDYKVGQTITINLISEDITAEKTTFILVHSDGDDLAIASKENPTQNAPTLVVTYETSPASENIESFVNNPSSIVSHTPNPQNLDSPNGEINNDSEGNEDSQVPSAENPDDETNENNSEPDDEKEGDGSSAGVDNNQESSTEDEDNNSGEGGEQNTENEVAQEKDEEKDSSSEEDNSENNSSIPPTNEKPNARISANKTKGEAPLKVDFNSSNSSDDKSIVTYKWDFKDGNGSSEKSVSHTFEKEGEYTVLLTVIDEEGQRDSDTVVITVDGKKNEAPTAKISANTTKGNAPLEVRFNSSSSSDDNEIEAYKWDFDDNSTSSSENPRHTFTEPGEYEVKLTVTDNSGLKNTSSLTVVVNAPSNEKPVAKISANTTKGEAPLEVRFSSSNSTDDDEIDSYEWDFGDGSTSSSENLRHTFSESGNYEVELTVTDKKGLTNTSSLTIVVEEPSNQKPVAVVKANTKNGTAPLTVQFSGSSSSDDKRVTSYQWDFGSHGTSQEDNPEMTFEQSGTYVVTLMVSDEQGLTDTDNITITVEPEAEPETPSTAGEVRYWQNLFDSRWSSERSKAYSMANSRGKNQEYYYLGLYIDGLSSMWQATGDNSYLDTALDIVGITVDKATSVGGGFLGWPASDGNQYGLWDTHYWRVVATLLRIMDQSNVKSDSKYRSIFNELLAFSEKHIWERYDVEHSSKIYRSNTHMSSHWARIGMELYLITKKNKYKQVFENMSHGSMPGLPSNFRNQIYPNPKNSSAYAWDKKWGTYGSNVQDTSHGGAIVSFWLLAYENGMYWNKSDMNALLKTVDIVWLDSDTDKIARNVDGTGGYGSQGKIHEWLNLARYSQSLQNKIKKHYDKSHLDFFGPQAIGIAALNAKILADGRAVYP
ncbi:PKD domain-containing protein [Euzebyella marina]|uniref:PKD domain-containing protein n=1 Tax=Euzebyella marina TaxID=1761453 RepID=A0A3G2L846_9FLAO|nr:PKD domain-containing protein [Euzebyella marina]AYN68439.1 PKD domain-containing protein [Euzebyella marina]